MVLNDFHTLPDLRSHWEKLCLRADGDFFGTFDWCEAWWRHYGQGRSLRLMLFYSHTKLVGIIPLFQETLSWGPFRIRVLRPVASDFGVTTCSFVVDPPYLEPIGRLLAEQLAAMPDWDVAQLGELPGYHESADGLAKSLAYSEWSVEFRNDNYPHMVLDLPPTFADYLATLRGNERHNILKRERRLRDLGNLRFEIVPPEQAAACFEEFVRQHQQQWQALGKLGHFTDWRRSLDFHRHLVSRQAALKRLMLMRVSVGQDVIGYQYCYIYNGRVHFIISSRAMSREWDYYSPGRLLHCAVVKAAIERKAHTLDSLGGYFDHKRRLGARVLGLQTITLRRHGRWAALRFRSFKAVTRLIDALYHRAWYWHIAPMLRRRFSRICPSFVFEGLWPRFVRTRFLVAANPAAVLAGKGCCGK